MNFVTHYNITMNISKHHIENGNTAIHCILYYELYNTL